MAGRSRLQLPESVRELGERIAQWRKSRPHLCAMPADLWKEAAALARAHGIYAIAHALPVSYAALKEKVGPDGIKQRPKSGAPRFIELPRGAAVFGVAPTDTVVEITNAAGDKLAIRLGPQTQFDVSGLAVAFIGLRP